MTKRNFLIVLAITGIFISLYLTYAKLTSSPVICSIGDCNKVQNSQYSEIFGIPVAVFGVLYYFVLFCLIYYKDRNIGLVNNEKPRSNSFGNKALDLWVIWGLVFSTYLTYLEIYVIKAICIWCVASYVDIISIFFVRLADKRS